MSKLVKDVTFGDDLHSKIRSGLEKVYKVAIESYGPNAGNALIEYPYGDPQISRDGVNNIRKLRFDDPIENAVAAIVTQASKQNEQSTGDGTTLSAVLSYHLYVAGRAKVAGGMNKMVVSRQLMTAAREVVKQLDELKKPLGKPVSLVDVATTSAGDEALGMLVAETVDAVGADGGVLLEDFSGRGVWNEIMEGFYFRQPIVSQYLLKDPGAMESQHRNVPILVLDKHLKEPQETADLMEKVIDAGFKELMIVGRVDGEALALIVQNHLDNKLKVSIVDAPYDARSLFLEDLALLTDATVITEGFDVNDFSADMLGMAAKAVVTTIGTTLLGADGQKAKIDSRIKELRGQLKDATSPVDIEMIRLRLSRLTGKVAIIRVGGDSPVDQQEIKLRVADAVGATQAALKDGYLPGGGSVLARLDVPFKSAFEAPFKQLAENNGSNPERLLFHLQDSPFGYGYNFRADVIDKPVNLEKEHVIDAALVIKEAVLNAASIASKLLTTGSAITLKDRDEKHD